MLCLHDSCKYIKLVTQFAPGHKRRHQVSNLAMVKPCRNKEDLICLQILGLSVPFFVLDLVLPYLNILVVIVSLAQLIGCVMKPAKVIRLSFMMLLL